MEGLAEANENTQWKEERVKNGPQYIAALSVTLFVFSSGTVLGWTSPTIPILRNSTLGMTADDEGWIGSLMPMGAMIGPFFGGIAADMIGRKRSMLVVGITVLISWTILAAAQSVWYLYAGRLIAGFALGWGMTVQPMYLGEIATADRRGALNALGNIQICLGFLYVYSFGPFVSYLWLCILCGGTAVVYFLSFMFMPESPFFLVLKDDMKGATKALKWLRGQSTAGVKKELNAIQVDVEVMLQNRGSWSDTFMNYGNRKAVVIIVALMALQQLCGVNAVLFNSQEIFDKANSGLSSSACTIVVGAVMAGASLLSPFTAEKMGRRLSVVLSAFAMSIALIGMGVFYYLDHIKADISNLTWLPLTAILTFISTYSVGVGPIPWLMISEVFAPNIRGNGAAISSASSWLLAFIVTKMFAPLTVAVGSHGAFWIFGVCSFIGAIVSHFYLPETKGKTLQEIQVMLNEK